MGTMITAARTTVAATATAIVTMPESLGDANVIRLKNTHGTVSVFLGAAGVATATGFELAAGQTLELNLQDGDTLHGIAASGTVVVSYLIT